MDIEMIREILKRLPIAIRTNQRELEKSAGQALFARAVLEYRRWPTAGEVITFLARRAATLRTVEQAIDKRANQIFIDVSVEVLKEFCTPEFLSKLNEGQRQVIDKLLALTPETFYPQGQQRGWPLDGVNDVLYAFESDDVRLPLDHAWRELLKEAQKRVEILKGVELAKIVIEAKLAKIDETSILDYITKKAAGGMFGHGTFFAEDGKARTSLINELKLPTTDLYLTGHEKPMKLLEAVDLMMKGEPTSFMIETKQEFALSANGHEHLAKMLAKTDEFSNDIVLLQWGELRAIGSEAPLVRESLFRFVVDKLGVDPREPAAFVARREVAIGGHRNSGYYYFCPMNKHGLTVVIGVGKNNDPDGHLRICRGDLEAAKQAILEHTAPAYDQQETGESRRQQRKALAEAPADVERNPFKHMQIWDRYIDEQFALRAHVVEELAKV